MNSMRRAANALAWLISIVALILITGCGGGSGGGKSSLPVASLAIVAGQTVQVGQSKSLTFTAKDANGNLVTVAPADAQFQVTAGSDKLRIINGQAQGLVAGTAQVTVTVKGITSPAAAVIVTAAGSTGADVSSLVALGHSHLNDMLTGQTPSNDQNLQILRDIFAKAYSQNPANPEAEFGFAISSPAYRAMAFYERIQGRSAGASADSTLNAISQRAVFWKNPSLGASVGDDAMHLALAAPFAGTGTSKSAGRSRAVDPVQVHAALADLKAAIDEALPAAEQAAGNAGLSFVIADYHAGAAATATINVDQGDAQAYVTSLYALRAIANIVLAYDTDWKNFDFSQEVQTALSAKLAAGTPIVPDDYLPPAPFATLAADGKVRFAAAQSDFSTASDRALTTLTTLQNRAVKTGHLLDATTWNMASLQTVINTFKTALTQKYTQTVLLQNAAPYPDTIAVTLTIDLNAWFTNPPASLRALLPTYQVATLQDNGNGYTTLTATPSAFPDKTFGGLLVNPPDAALTVNLDPYRNFGYLTTAGFPFLRIRNAFSGAGNGTVTIQ